MLRNRLERILKIAQVDFKKRYSDDILGLFWALLNPIFRIAVYYFVLTKALNVRDENFAFMLFSGLIIWMAFAEATRRGMNLLRAKRYLISSIQFDKIDMFIANGLTVFTAFLFNFGAYMLSAVLFGIKFSYTILYMPLIIILIFLFSMGVGMILSIINLFAKDIQHLWGMILLFGFWTSGVFGRTELFVNAFPPLKYINPFLGIIENARQIMLYGKGFDWSLFAFSSVYAIIVFITGLLIFNKYSHLALEKI